MSSTNQCSDCMFCTFMLLGFVMLAGGITTMIMSEGEMWGVALAIFVISLVFFLLAFRRRSEISTATKVVGIARSHERITMEELANLAQLPAEKVRDALYSAIASGAIHGTIEGNSYIRSSPRAAVSSTSTREREVVKVLVICPYCGAKTEQGLSKCQNCQADL
ncbi:MAG: PCI domain-containing protein [Candidatus Thorarchaeota archaeon]